MINWSLKDICWNSIYFIKQLLYFIVYNDRYCIHGRQRYISLCFHDTLRWRHNDHDGVSNHQPHGCLLNRLVKRRSKKTSKLRVTGLCVGNSPGPVNSPHNGPVTRKMFPFDDVIINYFLLWPINGRPDQCTNCYKVRPGRKDVGLWLSVPLIGHRSCSPNHRCFLTPSTPACGTQHDTWGPINIR